MATDCNDIANIVALGVLSGDDNLAKEIADLSLSIRENKARAKYIEGLKNVDEEIKGLSTHHLNLNAESDKIKIRAIVQASILEGNKSKGAYVELAKQIKNTKGSIAGGVNLLEKLSKASVTDYEQIAKLWGVKGEPIDVVNDIKAKLADFTATNYSISQYTEFAGDTIADIKKRLKDKKITDKQAEKELADVHKTVMDKIKKGDIPSGYAKIDEERQAIAKIAKGDEQLAMDMWTQYVMARELIADGGIDDDVLKIFKSNRIKDLAGPLTLDQINSYKKGDLSKLLARAYLNTKQLYSDGVLREAFRSKLVELASSTNMTVKDVDRVKRLIRMENFAKEGMTFTDVMENNRLYETARDLGLNVQGKTGDGLYNGLQHFCEKIAKEGIPEGPITIDGIEMQPSDVIQMIYNLTGDNNIIKLLNSGRFDDNTILGIATQYLFGDKKGAEKSILALFNKSKLQTKIDDNRGLVLKTITGVNVTSDKPVGYYNFREGLFLQDEQTRLKAQLFDKIANRNKMKVPSNGIGLVESTTNVDELVERLKEYKGGYLVVNDSRWGDNDTLRKAINKINFKDGKRVPDTESIDVIFPNRAMEGNFSYENGTLYFRTTDDAWFDEIAGTISIQSLGESYPTREIAARQYELTTGKNGDALRYQATYNNNVVNNKGIQLSDQQDEFFKLSKVRDANGNLLVVYHGSKTEFDIFDFNRIDKTEYGPGFYFTDDETYALHHGGGVVMETYVNITNPLEYDINAFRDNITQDQMEQIFQRLYNKGIFDDNDFDEFGDRIADAWSTNGDRAFTTFLDIHYAAKNKGQGKYFFDAVREITGYDGIVSHARKGQTFYVAFDQSQIKAIDNLEPTLNPSIRYQRMDYSLEDLPEGDYNKIEAWNKKVKFARQTGAYDFADDYEFLSNLYSNAQSFKSRINNNELDIIKKYMRVRHIVSDVAEWATKNNIDMKLLNEIDNIIPTGGLYEKNIFDSVDFIDYYKGVGNGNKTAKTIDDLLEYGGYDIDVPYGYGSNISSEDSLRGYEWNKKVKESRKSGDYSWADDYDVLKNIYNKAQSFKNRLTDKELDIVKKYMKNRHIISNVSDWAIKNKIDEKLLYEIDDIASLRYSNKIFGDSFVEYYKVVGDGNKLDDTYSAISNPSIRYQTQPSLFGQKSTYGTIDDVTEEIAADEALKVKLFKSDRTIKDIADQYGLPINIVKSIVTPEGLKAYGSYGNGIINIAELAKSSTAPHELFHAVFDLVDKKEKNNIIEQARKLFGDDVDVDEMLANKFSQYFRTGDFDFDTSKKTYKSLKEKIVGFFEKIKEWITGVDQYKTQVKSMFDNMINCEYLPSAGNSVDELAVLKQYDNEINDLAIKYYGEMLGVTGPEVDNEYIDRVQNLLSDITGIDVKAFSEIKDKAKLWQMVDERFTLDKMIAGKYDKEFIDIKEVVDSLSGLSDEEFVSKIKERLGNAVDNLTVDNEQLPLIKDTYLDLLTSPNEVDYLTAKGKLISLANGGKAESISIEQLRSMFRTNNFEDGYSMFLNGVDEKDKKKVIELINNNVFDILTIKFSENLVSAGYELPLINCKSLLYSYLKSDKTPDVNNLFVKALFTKNDIPITVDNLKILLDDLLPKNLDFDYVSGLYKGRLNQPNAGNAAVFTEIENRFLPDSYSALTAIRNANVRSISGGNERKILEDILNKYVEECRKGLNANIGFKEAQQLKQEIGYALDAFEQDILLPKFGNVLTYQERKQLLGMKYSLPIVVGGQNPTDAILNLEGITKSLLDKYDNLLEKSVIKNDLNVAILKNIKGSDNVQQKIIEERTKQLADNGYTIRQIGGEYVVYDVRQAIVDSLNPNNISDTIGGLDLFKGITMKQLESISNKQCYSLLRYIEAAKALDSQSNLYTKIMYKLSPQLAKIDFFRTFKIDPTTGLPRALISDTLGTHEIFKNIDTAGVDRDIKNGIFGDIKNKFKKNGYITRDELNEIIEKRVKDNISTISYNVTPKQEKDMIGVMNKTYNNAFIPYTYLRDLPTGGKLANKETLVNVKNRVNELIKSSYDNAIKDVKNYGDPAFDELLNRIVITTTDGDEILLKDFSKQGVDSWKKGIFNDENMFVKSAEDIEKPSLDVSKTISEREQKRFEREEKTIRENIVNQYNSTVNAVLNDIQIITDADRNIMGAIAPTVRQLMRKYTLTTMISDATDRVAGLNEEVARGIKSYLLGFKGRAFFGKRGGNDIVNRLKEVQSAYRNYYNLSLARLGTITPTTKAEGLALNLAKYFKTLEDSLGSADGLKGCTTNEAINRAFYHIGEVFLNIETTPGIYGMLSAVEQNQILKLFRYSKKTDPSYVKVFDLKRGKGEGALSQYRDFVQDVVGISLREFNDIFGTAYNESEFNKIIQGLAGFTLSGGSNALWQRLNNIVSGTTLLGRLMITFPFQALTIPQQGTAYFLKQLGQERRLGISNINEIDNARIKYGGILDGAYNELSLRNIKAINPDSLDPQAYYNRYGIPDIKGAYNTIGDIELTDGPEIIHSKIKSSAAKTEDGISWFERWIDPYKDNYNNIVDGVFARNFKNIAFFKALKENEVFQFSSIDQFTKFMDNPNIDPAFKKQLMDRVEALSGRNFRNLLGIGFGGLDRPISGKWFGNVAYGLMQMLNFRGAWGWNITKQTGEAITTGLKMIFNNGFLSKEAKDNIIEYISKTPEFLNFTTSLYNDLVWAWKLSRFNDNGQRPEDDEYGLMDFLDFTSKNMNLTSQWFQGLQSFGPFRPFQEQAQSMLQSIENPDVYKDTAGIGAFVNSLFKNFGRQWKPRNYIVKALGYWVTDGSDAAWAYIHNEFWKASAGSLRYMVGEQEGAYGYTYDFSNVSGRGIPAIIVGESNALSDKQFSYDLDNTSTRESLKLIFDADTLIDDKKTYRRELLLGMINGSQFFSFFKNIKKAIKGDLTSPYTADDFAELATKSNAGKEFYRYGYVTPTTTIEAKEFFDMILDNAKYRPGSKNFNKSVVQFEEYGHMNGKEEGNSADEEMEIWLNNMKYDDKGNTTDRWNIFIDTVKNNYYNETAVQDYILRSSKEWLNNNSDNPNYYLYESLLGQGELSNYIEQKIDENVELYNIGAGKGANNKWNKTEYKDVNYNQMLLDLGNSEFKGQGRTFFQQMQLLDKDTSTEYALAAISRSLKGEDAKELEKFYTVSKDENDISKLTIDYKFKKQMMQLASMERYLEEGNIEGFLAEASSIANPYLDKDPTGIVTAEIIDSINNRVKSANWLSAEEKSEIMVALFHNNRQYIEKNPEKLKELLGDDYDIYASEMNEMLHTWDEEVNDNIEQMQMTGVGGGEGGSISKAKNLSSALKSMRLPTSSGSGTSTASGRRNSYKQFVPTQIKGSELLKALGLKGYSPKDMSRISLEGYNPNVSLKINKDIKRTKPTRKSTQAISSSKQLSKLEDKTTKAITAES